MLSTKHTMKQESRKRIYLYEKVDNPMQWKKGSVVKICFSTKENKGGDDVVSETVIASVITLMRSSSLYNYVLLWEHCLESCISFCILSSIRVTIKFLLVLITNGEKIYSGNMSLFSNECFITFFFNLYTANNDLNENKWTCQ